MRSFKGLNGTMVLNDFEVLIKRESTFEQLFHGKGGMEIPYSSVKEVIFVPGTLVNGYISIIQSDGKRPSNIFEAMKSDNTVVFRLTKNRHAKMIKKLIEEKML